jgi:hypothetical protein
MPEDKTESKPKTAEDPQVDEDHPLNVARREGLRLSPLSQTEHLDTSGGGVTDLHRISPVFEEARQHAVRQGARVADDDYMPGTVVLPDDKDEADRARAHVKKLAGDLPDEEDVDVDRRPPGGYADGQGQAYNPDMVEKDAAARAGQDEDDAAAKPSSSTTKTPAKPTASTRSTSASPKTTSK